MPGIVKPNMRHIQVAEQLRKVLGDAPAMLWSAIRFGNHQIIVVVVAQHHALLILLKIPLLLKIGQCDLGNWQGTFTGFHRSHFADVECIGR